jgi:hypothetical protein
MLPWPMQDISHLSALLGTLGQYWLVRDIQYDKNIIPILAQGRKLAQDADAARDILGRGATKAEDQTGLRDRR